MKKFLKLSAIAASVILTAYASAGEIAVIVKTENSNFWQNVKGGAMNAQKELAGAHTVSFQGPEAETNVVEQVNMMDNAINRKVSGIVLAPSDPDALAAPVKKAWENGIPVVIIDSRLNDGSEQYYQSFLATDNRAAGAAAAKAVIDAAGSEGKISIMSFTPGAGSAIDRVGGFEDYIKENSNLQSIGTFYSQADMVTALNQTIDVLASHSDLTAIFGANEPTAVGMARAIKQQGYGGKITAVGFDGNQDLQEFVNDGTLDGIIVQSSYQMGYKGVLTINDILDGKKVEKYIDTGIVYVTKDNINTEEAKAVLY